MRAPTPSQRRPFPAFTAYLCAATLLFSISGCKKAGDATGASDNLPDALMIVQGGDQVVQAGKALPTTVVLRVVNKDGVGIPKVTVALLVAAGGGTVTPSSDTTDANGEIQAKWTLGTAGSDQSILAMVAGLTPVPIRATGILPEQIILVQGGGQTAKVGAGLTNSIIVRIVGGANVPLQGITIGFQVLTGGGAMSPQTVVTNALGEAVTKWTLGAAVGFQTVQAVVGSLSPLTITANAIP